MSVRICLSCRPACIAFSFITSSILWISSRRARTCSADNRASSFISDMICMASLWSFDSAANSVVRTASSSSFASSCCRTEVMVSGDPSSARYHEISKCLDGEGVHHSQFKESLVLGHSLIKLPLSDSKAPSFCIVSIGQSYIMRSITYHCTGCPGSAQMQDGASRFEVSCPRQVERIEVRAER
jgi:hypothetical protein